MMECIEGAMIALIKEFAKSQENVDKSKYPVGFQPKKSQE